MESLLPRSSTHRKNENRSVVSVDFMQNGASTTHLFNHDKSQLDQGNPCRCLAISMLRFDMEEVIGLEVTL